ncbi:MAG: aminopeptidase P family protein [Deltaproteobacteria bacterium]|nr:aminopeptidase P family protein [Deltaproteobacteria bacterium]
MADERRVRELQRRMKGQGLDAAVLLQPRDLFYYSGTSQPCNLLVPAEGEPVLFVRRAEGFVRDETWIGARDRGGSPRQLREALQQLGLHGGTLGLELDVVPYALVSKMASVLDSFTFVDVSPLVLEQRMVKDPEEIEWVRGATERFDLAHRTLLESIRPGVTEVELGSRIAKALIRDETEQVVFIRRWDDWLQPMGTVASGGNLVRISGHAHTVTGVGLGPALPWGPSGRALEPGDLVVVDNPLNYRGYHSDNTRTYVVGEASARQREVYRDLRHVQDEALRRVRPGVPVNELFLSAVDLVGQLGYAEAFQGFGDSQGRYLGHGVGLELDEIPVLDSQTDLPLQVNMVLAVECKFILPGFGAVFLEDTVVVRDEGAEILSRSDRGLAEVR